jgi:uncharacterized protein (TIGR02611 family)
MTADPEQDPEKRRFPFRDEVWGDEPQEVDASELVQDVQAEQPDLVRRWHDHRTVVPLKIVGRFIRRSGKRVAVTVAGFVLVIAGIAGLALPIVPGWLLIIPGLALLATEYVWAQRLLKIARAKATQAKDMVFRKKPEEPGDQPAP